MGRKLKVVKEELEAPVLDLYSQGLGYGTIAKMVKQRHDVSLSKTAIKNYLNKRKTDKIERVDPVTPEIHQLVSEAAVNYRHAVIQAREAEEREEHGTAGKYMKQAGEWWDRMSKVLGMVAPDNNLNVEVHGVPQKYVKTAADLMCDNCADNIIDLEYDDESGVYAGSSQDSQ